MLVARPPFYKELRQIHYSRSNGAETVAIRFAQRKDDTIVSVGRRDWQFN